MLRKDHLTNATVDLERAGHVFPRDVDCPADPDVSPRK